MSTQVVTRDDPRDGAIGRRHPILEGAERLVGLVLLVGSAPLLLVLLIAVRLDSPGSPLFVQRRVARGGRETFRFLKMRTMYVDAPVTHERLYRYRRRDLSTDAIRRQPYKDRDDPRVTRLGAWLRRTSLDELPNLWHVVTGEMSLVGPRPEVPEMLRHYTPGERAKFDVRPGVTGLAQVSGRGSLTVDEVLALDLAYVRQRTWRGDVMILVRSVRVVLLGIGAY